MKEKFLITVTNAQCRLKLVLLRKFTIENYKIASSFVLNTIQVWKMYQLGHGTVRSERVPKKLQNMLNI